MIDAITGRVVRLEPDHLVIETGGVAFRIFCPTRTLHTYRPGEEEQVYVHLIVRDDGIHLFGFPITNSIIGAWLTIVVLVGFSYVITRRMKLIPGRLQSAFEFLLGWLYDLCRPTSP